MNRNCIHHRRRKVIGLGLALLGCLLLSTPRAFAWNAHGHMTVAAIAYKKLDPAVREKVDALLKLNPSYPGWVAQVPEPKRPLIAFMVASTWADQIRRDGVHTNDSDPSAHDARRNIGYGDNLVHPYWHYINLPYSPDGTALKTPVEPNVRTQIATFRSALASPSTSDNVKSYDLVWLLHLVGDVHQPLHAISRFDREQPTPVPVGRRGRFNLLLPQLHRDSVERAVSREHFAEQGQVEWLL